MRINRNLKKQKPRSESILQQNQKKKKNTQIQKLGIYLYIQ